MQTNSFMAIAGFLVLLDTLEVSHCEDCEKLRYSILAYIHNHLAEGWKAISLNPLRDEKRRYRKRSNRELVEIS